MPANVVKNKSEEKLWERAKKEAAKSKLKGDAKWALTNSIFQKMKKAHSAADLLDNLALCLASRSSCLRLR